MHCVLYLFCMLLPNCCCGLIILIHVCYISTNVGLNYRLHFRRTAVRWDTEIDNFNIRLSISTRFPVILPGLHQPVLPDPCYKSVSLAVKEGVDHHGRSNRSNSRAPGGAMFVLLQTSHERALHGLWRALLYILRSSTGAVYPSFFLVSVTRPLIAAMGWDLEPVSRMQLHWLLQERMGMKWVNL